METECSLATDLHVFLSVCVTRLIPGTFFHKMSVTGERMRTEYLTTLVKWKIVIRI